MKSDSGERRLCARTKAPVCLRSSQTNRSVPLKRGHMPKLEWGGKFVSKSNPARNVTIGDQNYLKSSAEKQDGTRVARNLGLEKEKLSGIASLLFEMKGS